MKRNIHNIVMLRRKDHEKRKRHSRENPSVRHITVVRPSDAMKLIQLPKSAFGLTSTYRADVAVGWGARDIRLLRTIEANLCEQKS